LWKKKILKIREFFFFKSAKIFSLFLNVKKEHVHNLNRRWAQSALKALNEGREAP